MAGWRAAIDYVMPERAAMLREEGERVGSTTPPPVSVWGITKPEDVAWVRAREVRHPYATMTQPVRLSNETALARIPKTFVYCSSPATGTFDQFAAKARNDRAWRFHELRTGHDAMLLQPEAVANILLEE